MHPNHYKKNLLFFSSSIRMRRKNLNFGEKKIKKRLLQKQKSNQDR